jgi:hypothetical protein
VSWTVLLGLAVATLAVKAAGPLLLARHSLAPSVQRIVQSMPLAIYPTLVASATMPGGNGTGTLTERLVPAVLVLGLLIAVRRRNIFAVAMLAGAVATALIRLAGA